MSSNLFDKQNTAPTQQQMTPEQYFSGVVGQARELQEKIQNPQAEAQNMINQMMQSGRLNQAQVNKMYGLAQSIAARFGR